MAIKTYSQSTANYVVVDSGYTGRLAKQFNFIPYKITDSQLIAIETITTQNKQSQIVSEKTLDENENESLSDEDETYDDENPDGYGVIFIYDVIHGDGLYVSPNINIKEYETDILKIIKLLDDISGIIVFKTNTKHTDYTSWLRRSEYCAWFDVMDTSVIIDDTDGFHIIVIDADTESG